jgi:hypothetical protein
MMGSVTIVEQEERVEGQAKLALFGLMLFIALIKQSRKYSPIRQSVSAIWIPRTVAFRPSRL